MEKKKKRNTGKKNKSRVSCMTEVMKPEIWEKFPEDLFEVVLARLPMAKIICFRTVCQQWNNLITSQSFSQQCSKVSQVNPWFCISHGHYNYKTIYDPCMKRWYNPKLFDNKPGQYPRLVCSAGGLVCFEDDGYLSSIFSFAEDLYRRTILYVCNPITQSFKKLPIGSIKIWQ